MDLKKIDFISIIRLCRRYGLFEEPVMFPDDYRPIIVDSYTKLVNKLFPLSKIKTNSSSLSIYFQGDAFSFITEVEQLVWIKGFNNPVLAESLKDVSTIISRFSNVKIKNGVIGTTFDTDIEKRYLQRDKLFDHFDLLASLSVNIDSLQAVYNTILPELEEFFRKQAVINERLSQAQSKLREKRVNNNNAFYAAFNAQAIKEQIAMEQKLSEIVVVDNNIRKWILVGTKVQVVENLETQEWYAYPVELDAPPEYRVVDTSTVESIHKDGLIRAGGYALKFNEEHWLKLLKADNKPEFDGLYYCHTDCSFIVVTEGVEYAFLTYESAVEFVRVSGINVNTDLVHIYNNSFEIIDMRRLERYAATA